MKLPNICNTNLAFTTFEILIVTSIFSILIGLGLLVTLSSYHNNSSRTERDTLLGIIEKTRSRALNNYLESAHGICLDTATSNYVMFRGLDYSANDDGNELVPANKNIVITGLPKCGFEKGIVFNQLSATTSPTDIIIALNFSTTTISINYEGAISY